MKKQEKISEYSRIQEKVAHPSVLRGQVALEGMKKEVRRDQMIQRRNGSRSPFTATALGPNGGTGIPYGCYGWHIAPKVNFMASGATRTTECPVTVISSPLSPKKWGS